MLLKKISPFNLRAENLNNEEDLVKSYVECVILETCNGFCIHPPIKLIHTRNSAYTDFDPIDLS